MNVLSPINEKGDLRLLLALPRTCSMERIFHDCRNHGGTDTIRIAFFGCIGFNGTKLITCQHIHERFTDKQLYSYLFNIKFHL